MPVLARGSTSAGAAGLRAGRADAIGHSRKNAVMRAARPATEGPPMPHAGSPNRSEEHTSELQSLMRTSYAVFCLKKTNHPKNRIQQDQHPKPVNTTTNQQILTPHKVT